AKLPQKDFLRVHRSFIVSLASIQSFTSESVEINEKEIPVSRSYKTAVLKKLEKP
ncbi:MAG: LytTR family transcriptional regulator, partial [Bacteroidetes bacterium]|nr:LytTR family transcriptional regulator [Bacteroidota bacterium]